MSATHSQPALACDDGIDRQILLLLERHSRMTFLALAEHLPACTWRTLFIALSRLHLQGRIELLALKRDYEILRRTAFTPRSSSLEGRDHAILEGG